MNEKLEIELQNFVQAIMMSLEDRGSNTRVTAELDFANQILSWSVQDDGVFFRSSKSSFPIDRKPEGNSKPFMAPQQPRAYYLNEEESKALEVERVKQLFSGAG